jgi:uncharacterized membrane protein (UPF0127 family)
MKLRILYLALLLVGVIPDTPAAELPTIPLVIKKNKITAEVVNTPAQREVGLMNRFSIRSDEGMLFVFPEPQMLSFWMKNTYIALSIAFIDGEGKIINIEDMAPQTLDLHPSTRPGLYALEMRKGWFKERGITAGTKIEGIEKAPHAVN